MTSAPTAVNERLAAPRGDHGDASEPMTDANQNGASTAPLISVGLPAYNSERYLAEAIDCVLAQTHDNLEVIISDNASTDGTRGICEGYTERDPRVRYVREAENRGAAYNFQRVLDLARGRYFRWMAADDLCAPELLQRCLAVLDRRPEVVMAYPKADFIAGDGQHIFGSDDVYPPAPWPADVTARVRRAWEAIFHDGTMAMVALFGLARVDDLRAGRAFGNYRGADCTVVTELALRGPIVELPETLASFRRHAGAASMQPSARSHQQFHDPSVRNRLVVRLQFQRWYLEQLRSLARSSLSWREQASLASTWAHLLLGKVTRRLRRYPARAGT